MTELKKQELKRALQESRFRLLLRCAALALPLRSMYFVATKEVWRISTNGSCIYFDPDWFRRLGPEEIDFVLAHQLMHLALGHTDRPPFYRGARFHLACDIVANSHLRQLGWVADRIPRVGRIYSETFFPAQPGFSLTSTEALSGVPFDPADLRPGVRRTYQIDSEEWWERAADPERQGVVVLSPYDKDPADLVITEELKNLRAPWKKERFHRSKEPPPSREPNGKKKQSDSDTQRWEEVSKPTVHSLQRQKNHAQNQGAEAEAEERSWQKPSPAGLDWRLLLNQFLQREIRDYTFTPPDRRYQELDFFLPDYNILPEPTQKLLFMVDTSGSVEDPALNSVYRELLGALTQFQEGVTGLLGFFDERVYPPRPFCDEESLRRICPKGGGGTDFKCIFRYLKKMDDRPCGIVIFTDGKAVFPPESVAEQIPVLWLFTQKDAAAPWGRSAYVPQ